MYMHVFMYLSLYIYIYICLIIMTIMREANIYVTVFSCEQFPDHPNA